ncbi:class I SAM-dependent methyltransferase [Mariniblastus sp.]|nr:class I SAM-dependent methyltransferase [Mariniblastus sp.]MDB4379987.1 class I SAM-dependent methyltransferase [Mariniblastus sp.]
MENDRGKSTSGVSHQANWQIPQGVTASNWEYAQANHISTGYDKFLLDDPLTMVDRQILARYLPDLTNGGEKSPNGSKPLIADFGCGNGRTLIPLLNRGYAGVGIDLSIPMLNAFQKKIGIESDRAKVVSDSSENGCFWIQANLVELDGIVDAAFDHGISLFSTLGMIRGKENRQLFLKHARRTIQPGGWFILHAHNVWYQLRHPGGIRWALGNGIQAIRGKSEFGDRESNYRGINNMFIHSFRRKELTKALSLAGFREFDWFGVSPHQNQPVDRLPFGHPLRLVGWIVACR